MIVSEDHGILLCEECGYEIGGLTGACPECGRPIERSLPSHRSGSPWQRRPGPLAWLRTLVALARHPVEIWDHVRVESGRSLLLGVVNILLAAACTSAGLLLRGPAFGAVPVDYALSFFLGSAVVLVALTVIEFIGIRFFGGRRGWRTTGCVAMAVVGHATAGWLVSGLLFGFLWHVGQHMNALPQFRFPSWLSLPPALATWTILLPTFGFFLGLVIFEVLVYMGFRAMRFANSDLAGTRQSTTG